MTNRHRGDYFERQTRDALRAVGWVVIRGAGSMGPADLVALRADMRPLLISCKLHGRIGPAERLDLMEYARKAGARPLLALREKPGWVQLRTVNSRPDWLPVDSIKVPARKRDERE